MPLWKQRWIADLDSGVFEQGEGCLYKDGHYCCLGVLGTSLNDPAEVLRLGNIGTLGDAGLEVPMDLLESAYAELNDDWGLSFGEIAQMICLEHESGIDVDSIIQHQERT